MVCGVYETDTQARVCGSVWQWVQHLSPFFPPHPEPHTCAPKPAGCVLAHRVTRLFLRYPGGEPSESSA